MLKATDVKPGSVWQRVRNMWLLFKQLPEMLSNEVGKKVTTGLQFIAAGREVSHAFMQDVIGNKWVICHSCHSGYTGATVKN